MNDFWRPWIWFLSCEEKNIFARHFYGHLAQCAYFFSHSICYRICSPVVFYHKEIVCQFWHFLHKTKFNLKTSYIKFVYLEKATWKFRKSPLFWCYILVMGSSWNFPARARSSYEGSESSLAGALQFSSWNRADNIYNMYVKK